MQNNNNDNDENKKLKKNLLYIILNFLTLSLVIVCALSFAWFYRISSPKQSGMLLEPDLSANLVIAETPEILADVLNLSDNPVCVSTVIEASKDFAPCTRHNDELCYIKNIGGIQNSTGYLAGSSEYIYEPVPADSEFYKDYTVYIACGNTQLTNTELIASISDIDKSDADTHSYMAASVDFYIDSVSNANYKGTLNVAGKDIADPLNSKTTCTIDLPGDTIPCTTDGYVRIVMRFYYDGALPENETTAYINDDTVSFYKTTLEITFSAEEK